MLKFMAAIMIVLTGAGALFTVVLFFTHPNILTFLLMIPFLKIINSSIEHSVWFKNLQAKANMVEA